jgi:hypothetical protein
VFLGHGARVEAAGGISGRPMADPRSSRGGSGPVAPLARSPAPARSNRTLRVPQRRLMAPPRGQPLRACPLTPAAPVAPTKKAPSSREAEGGHGGGGSRTRVREGFQLRLYVRRALLISPTDTARARPDRAICLSFSSPTGQRRRMTSPIHRRLRSRYGLATSGDGPARTNLTQPVPGYRWQL